jgi:5-formyltetrahydrofolate cyclo-ligase
VGEDQQAQRETLRRRLRDERQALSDDEIRVASAAVCAQVAALPAFVRARKVALYAATRGEIDTSDLRAPLAVRGLAAYYPCSAAGAAPRLHFRALDAASALVAARFGILEPPAHAAEVPASELDVVLVPGVAFARDGHRLGYGRGYYDSALRDAPRALRIGLAHEFQVVDHIPPHDGDEPVDLIVTPRARIVTRARMHAPEEVLS